MIADRLSVFDAIFYYSDNRRVAMQANVAILVDGPIDFRRYRDWLAPRIESTPKLQTVLRPAPFDLLRPAWQPSGAFNLDDHVSETAVQAPGGEADLRTTLTDLIHHRLPRSRPLWRLVVINGLAGGQSALLLQSHHCFADAEGILEIFRVLFEADGGAAKERAAAAAEKRAKGLKAAKGRTRLGLLFDYVRARVAQFPFTRPVSGRVNIAWCTFPAQDLRAAASALGGTVTDAVLTALGIAADAYAERARVDVNGKKLLLQVPANVRLPNRYGELGNELAMLPGVVPLGIDNAAERFRLVADYNRALKSVDMAAFVHRMMAFGFRAMTPPGQAIVCRTMVSKPYLHAARVLGLPPQEHGLMSSVVVPPASYRVDGQRIVSFINIVACQFNMGFVCSPVLYGDTITFALSVDRENFGEADPFIEDFTLGIAQLVRAAQIQ